MVKIRLSRYGKKNQPTFRIVVSDSRKDVHGTYIEAIGRYNPSVQPHEIEVNKERALYWLSQGAQASPSVHNILVEQGVIDAKKKKASKIVKVEDTKDTNNENNNENTDGESIEETKAGDNDQEVKSEDQETVAPDTSEDKNNSDDSLKEDEAKIENIEEKSEDKKETE